MEEGPEPQQWVERAAEEHHHAHAHGGVEGGKSSPPMSAIAAATLAVLASIGSLLSGHAANQSILAQSKATNLWAYHQAKSTKGHLYEVGADILKAVNTPTTQAAEVQEHFRTEKGRYDKEKGEIQHEAEKLEEESRHELHKHHRYATGVAMLQVGIVLASVSILVKYRGLFLMSLLAGIVGVTFLIVGLAAM